MKTPDAIQWFKNSFGKEIGKAVAGTPFTLDMVAAIAFQETGYLWAPLVARGLSPAELLKACVGDTFDAPDRDAFPTSKSALLAAPRGAEMFAVAREALETIGKFDRTYGKVAEARPNKFCHGFGIFQYDLQFYPENPSFFLEKKWHDFGECLALLIGELKAAKQRAFGPLKKTLNDTERVFVAIAYNSGSVNLQKGFKQGHENDEGQFYGENVFEFLRIAQSVGGKILSGAAKLKPGTAPLPDPTKIEATKDIFMVVVRDLPLRLRSEPRIPKNKPTANVIARLPDGQLVHGLSGTGTDDFREVETNLNGAYFRGFAASEFLIPVRKAEAVSPAAKPKKPKKPGKVGKTGKPLKPVAPTDKDPTTGIVAVYMPRQPGTITGRIAPAGPHSLNEPGQPGRHGETATARCAELAAIIDWLAVDKPAHKRYQPTSTATFCNIYAHDYCFLAGAYLPRVWWLPSAIEQLAHGETVEPLYEKTIDEQRANDLFRWLIGFGERFGWRQTGTLTKLQEAANLGGLGIIVARRKDDGRSGHIVAVVPETLEHQAKRNSDGEVVAPLQSQAGSVNFRYGTGRPNWWQGEQFAGSGFWIHA
jgi:hypothetical protein